MLLPIRLGSSTASLAILLFLALPTILYYRSPLLERARVRNPSSVTTSLSQSILGDKSSLVEQNVLFDVKMEGGPRIRQATMLFGTSRDRGQNVIYERATKTHLKHAERWGYPTHILRQDIVGKGDWKRLLFGKLLYMLSLIVAEMAQPVGRRAEWLVWFDADTIILNENIPWETFLPPSGHFRETNMLGSKDWNGFNCGVFFLRINEWSVNYLTAATALPLLRPELPMVQRGPNYEQDAMVWVLEQKEYKAHVVYQPREWYNLFELQHDQNTLKYKPGDLLVHAVGVQDKQLAMGLWLDKLDNSLDELQLPLSNMNLKGDVERFWTILKGANDLLGRAKTFRESAEVMDSFSADLGLAKQFEEAHNELERLSLETQFEMQMMADAQIKLEAKIGSFNATKARKEAEDAQARVKEAEEKARQKGAQHDRLKGGFDAAHNSTIVAGEATNPSEQKGGLIISPGMIPPGTTPPNTVPPGTT